jgi:hypothetical protein
MWAMRIDGLGEFENIQKAIRKDSAKRAQLKSGESAAKAEAADEVEISPKARLLAKISQLPEVRQEKVREALAKLEDGTLTNPEAVQQGIQQMLKEML